MREPKPPANERARLAALARYEILDTDKELAYDEIIRLASFICGTPIALVSLVDAERQWFKARRGLEAEQTSRTISFCGHVVERGELLVVNDAAEDERFADNPLVLGGPRLRFYAGAPLQTHEGLTLGTLCVADTEPGELSSEQIDMLEVLSRLVLHQLERRKAELERAAAEAAAERATRLRQRYFDVSPDMLCVANFEGVFVELNGAWSATLGWTVEELCSKPFVEFVHPEDRARTISESAALAEGEHVTVHFTNRYATKFGDYRWLDWTATPDLSSGVIVAAARDITEQKARERELVEARRAAESANEAKSDFLAKMSHELRTPLNSVIGFTNLLRKNRKGNLDDKDLTYLEKIGKNGIHLLSLINDLLDLSKIEAGRTELDLQPVSLAALCTEVVDETEGVIQAEGNELRVTVPAGLAPIQADPRRLKQVLINLVGNANKFTERGCVELRVCESAVEPGQVGRIEVVDSGIGIAPEQLDVVFEAFRQASEGGGRTHGGTGLGLAISRSLAVLHGFELGVVSELGRGSTFYLRVRPDAGTPEHRPATAGPSDVHGREGRDAGAQTPGLAASLETRTVLVIEDNSDARNLAVKAVEQLGARVVTADSGLSGLRVAAAIVPDVIVLDLGLPDLHGREVVRRLSTDAKLRHIPVVIYSADPDGLGELRPTSVLEKPVNIDEIAETLAGFLGPKRRVLVVDDDDDTREVLCSVLRGLGVDTFEARDGHDALTALRGHGADLVMLDICMPRMSGFEFLSCLRVDPDLRETPVVICTALDLEPSQERAVAGEAQAIIRKGIKLEGRLEQVIHRLFRETPT